MAINIQEAQSSQSRTEGNLRREWCCNQRPMEKSLKGPRNPDIHCGSGVEFLCFKKKLGGSGAINKTQSHWFLKGRKPYCAMSSYSQTTLHTTHTGKWASIIQSQAKDLALLVYSSSYLVDIEHIHGKKCYTSFPDTESKSVGLQFLDLFPHKDIWVVMNTNSDNTNMSTIWVLKTRLRLGLQFEVLAVKSEGMWKVETR